MSPETADRISTDRVMIILDDEIDKLKSLPEYPYLAETIRVSLSVGWIIVRYMDAVLWYMGEFGWNEFGDSTHMENPHDYRDIGRAVTRLKKIRSGKDSTMCSTNGCIQLALWSAEDCGNPLNKYLRSFPNKRFPGSTRR